MNVRQARRLIREHEEELGLNERVINHLETWKGNIIDGELSPQGKRLERSMIAAGVGASTTAVASIPAGITAGVAGTPLLGVAVGGATAGLGLLTTGIGMLLSREKGKEHLHAELDLRDSLSHLPHEDREKTIDRYLGILRSQNDFLRGYVKSFREHHGI